MSVCRIAGQNACTVKHIDAVGDLIERPVFGINFIFGQIKDLSIRHIINSGICRIRQRLADPVCKMPALLIIPATENTVSITAVDILLYIIIVLISPARWILHFDDFIVMVCRMNARQKNSQLIGS